MRLRTANNRRKALARRAMRRTPVTMGRRAARAAVKRWRAMHPEIAALWADLCA